MTRAHLARRMASLLGVLALGLAGTALQAAPSHARVALPEQSLVAQYGWGSGCPVLGGYSASTPGQYLEFPYVGGTVSGFGFGWGYPWFSTPYPVWGGGFGYVPYTYYPAVGTPAAGVAPGYWHPINAYAATPGPLGPPAPAGLPYTFGFPTPPTYPASSYPGTGAQPIGSFTGFWDPFYVGRGAGRADTYGLGC
jgi:hypothetical protein